MKTIKRTEPRLIRDDKYYPVYLNEYDNETKTHRDLLQNCLDNWLRQIDTIVDMLDDDAYAKYGFVTKAVLRSNYAYLDALFNLIKKHIGEIWVDEPMRDELTCNGLPVGVSFTPVTAMITPEPDPEIRKRKQEDEKAPEPAQPSTDSEAGE